MGKRTAKAPSLSPAVGSLIAIAIVSAGVVWAKQGVRSPAAASLLTRAQHVTIEHRSAVILTLTATAHRTPGLIEMRHDGTETVTVIVPSDWRLREARNALLSVVQGPAPQGGQRRWKIPAGATLSFEAASTEDLLLHNLSSTLVHIKYDRLDLTTGTKEEDSVLLDQKTLRIW